MTHILGLITLGSILVTAGGVMTWLGYAAREPRTWLRRVRAPKLAAGELLLADENWVGLV